MPSFSFFRPAQLASSRVLNDLKMARPRFYWHPLYRRWSNQAHRTRLATFSEELPDYLLNLLPSFSLVFPLFVLFIAIFFGLAAFKAVMTVVWIILVTLALLSSGMGIMFGAGLTAYFLASEHEKGHWDIFMLLPQDRMGLLMMRVSAVLFPYRPLITTLEVIQTVTALIVSIVLNARLDSPEKDVLGACFVYLIPVLLVLTWERRQDHALSLALGMYTGLSRRQQFAVSWALGGGLMLWSMRLMLGLLAFGLSPVLTLWGVALPTMIGGAAMLPIVAVRLPVAIPLIGLYYISREALIFYLWRKVEQKMRGWD